MPRQPSSDPDLLLYRPSPLEDLELRLRTEEAKIARQIIDWAESKSLWIQWGKGAVEGTYYPMLNHEGKANKIFGVFSTGRIEIDFRHHPFENEAQKVELLGRLNSIPGVSMPDKAIETWSSFPLSTLKEASSLKHFFEISEWVIEEIKRS
jgi:hypothetical protein